MGYEKPFLPDVPHIHLPKAGHIRQFWKVSTSIFTATAENRGKCCRCGRVRRGNAVQRACSRDTAEKAIPQRQRIAGNAAVVEGGRRGNTVQRACSRDTAEKAIPQRQRIAGNAAVVERGRRDNSVQKACSKDTAEKLFRNGRESREMLPLWKVAGEAMPSRGPAAGIRRKKLFRNGREMRNLLPLW